MAGRSPSIAVQITGDVKSLQKAFGQAETSAQRLQRKMSDFGTKMTLGVTLPLVGVGVAVVKAFKEQEVAEAKLASAFDSMQANAWTSIDALKAQAKALQDVTTYGDEATLKMQSVLLTFANITDRMGADNDVFTRTTKVVLDMAAALDMDLQSAAIQLGKALNDPVANLSALGRAGIQFSDEQETMIKSLAKSGDMLGAQKIILAELERQFGGTAEAIAKTDAGKMQQAMNDIADAMEEMGAIILPVVSDILENVAGLASAFGDLDEGTQKAILSIGLLAAATGPLAKLGALAIGAFIAVQKLWNSLAILSMIGGGGAMGVLRGLGLVLGGMANPVAIAAVGIAAVAASVVTLGRNINDSIDDFRNYNIELDKLARQRRIDMLVDQGYTLAEAINILDQAVTSTTYGAWGRSLTLPTGTGRSWESTADAVNGFADAWAYAQRNITDPDTLRRIDGWIDHSYQLDDRWGEMSDTLRDETVSQSRLWREYFDRVDGILDDVTGLFKDAPDQIAVSFTKWEDELTGQNDAMRRWADGIQTLMAAGMVNIAKEILEAGPAAADAVDAFVADMAMAAKIEQALVEQLQLEALLTALVTEAFSGSGSLAVSFFEGGISLAKAIHMGFTNYMLEHPITQWGISSGEGDITVPINSSMFQKLDSGGIVAGPVGSPQLVIAHGGETVLPTHKTGSAGSGVTVNMYVSGSVWGSDAEDLVVSALQRAERRGRI